MTDRVLRFELEQVTVQWLMLAEQVELLDRLAPTTGPIIDSND